MEIQVEQYGENMTLLVNTDSYKFNNGRKAITTHMLPSMEAYSTVSVNLVNESINADETFVKIKNEEEKIFNALIDNKIISEPIRYAHSGFNKYALVKIIK